MTMTYSHPIAREARYMLVSHLQWVNPPATCGVSILATCDGCNQRDLMTRRGERLCCSCGPDLTSR